MTKILIVDDDPDILEFLSYNFKKNDYSVEVAENGFEAIRKVDSFHPDLILLDVMMPEMDGIETCKRLRENPANEDIIITFLTARGEEYSQIAGYESGADDYITKPIKPQVLMSKVKSLLRRKNIVTDEENNKTFKIDEERYIVVKDGKEYFLPKKEFELVKFLSSQPEKVFKREEIYDSVWGKNLFVGDRTLDVHIRKIRQKLGDDIITTIKGIGYKFNA